MDILNSDWLINMLEKASASPHGRLIAVFEILEDWLDAPNIREQIGAHFPAQSNAKLLQNFLTLEASKAGAAMPEMLANQLYFMAIAAAQEKLQANNPQSLQHAKNAARALIAAQTKKEFHIKQSSAYAMAASLVVALIGAGVLYMHHLAPDHQQIALTDPVIETELPTAAPTLMASPEQTAALVAQLELMRHGNCQLIEAIQLPDSQKAIYINMVVNGRVPTDLQEQIIASDLIKKSRCNYTPMLMANSKG